MARTIKIDYVRNTTYTFTHVYQKNGVDSSDGITLFFTVKTTQYDTAATDTTAVIQKTVAMSGPSTVVTINPTDLAATIAPGTYYFDIKIKESDGPPKVIYPGAAGIFNIIAEPTNRTS